MKGERSVPPKVAARRIDRVARDYPVYGLSVSVIALCLSVMISNLFLSIVKGPPFPVLKDPLLFWATFVLVGGGIGLVGLAWRRARLNRPPSRGLRLFALLAACALVPATLFEVFL